MHIVSTESTAQPAAPSRDRLVSHGYLGTGQTWKVYSNADHFFFFFTIEGADASPLFASPPEYSTAPKAERAARAWSAPSAPPEEVILETETRASEAVAGWQILVSDDRGGTYRVDLVNEETGELGPETFAGYDGREVAIAAARAWALEHPCDGSMSDADVRQADEDFDPITDQGGGPDLDAGATLTGEALPVAAPEPADPRDAELDQLRAERDLAIRQRDAALDTIATDVSEVRAEAEECLRLDARRQRILLEVETLKDELKFIDAKLKTRTVDAMRMVTTIGQGWQQRLTFAESAETRAVVGHAAERAAKSLGAPGQAGPAMTWAFNGVTYQVDHDFEKTDDGERWTTWLRGHKGTTEEHGFTYEQALEATQNAASVVFIDFEPGATASVADAGPVADGARKPSKRKPLKLKGHDQAAVIAAVEQNLTLPDAAAELKCTEQQLKAYAEKAGLVLSKHQARRAGDELPAAPATPAAAKKTSKRGAKRGTK